MINPQPVNDRRSPYSAATPSDLPKTLRPLPGPVSPTPPKKRNWKRIIGLTVVTVIFAIGAYAYAQYRSLRDNVLVDHEGQSAAILSYDPANKNSKLDASQFTHIGDGRFNIVLAGVGGPDHPGSYLTDSIQVVSVDTINKKVGITSIPRDLYVTIPGYGRAKINSAYSVGEQRKAGSGAALMREVVGNVLGIRVSNFAMFDFQGLEDIVNALGGIDLYVDKAINDPTFPADDTLHYAPFNIAAGQQHMNGKTALNYSRSRHTTSDFDRSRRQQQVISAIKNKALSAGVLTNPIKINNLITALGKHFKMDMTTDQVKALISIYKDIPSNSTQGFVLDTSADLGLLTSTTDPVAGYIAYPPAGFDKFEEIHRWFIKNNPDPLLAREAPTVTVVNGGKASNKQMQDFVSLLKDYGYNATLSTQSVSKKYTATQLFMTRSGESKPFSRNYLSTQFGTTAQNGSPASSSSDFEIIYFPTSSLSTPAPSPSTAANVKR